MWVRFCWHGKSLIQLYRKAFSKAHPWPLAKHKALIKINDEVKTYKTIVCVKCFIFAAPYLFSIVVFSIHMLTWQEIFLVHFHSVV